jgi:hypothetical protein
MLEEGEPADPPAFVSAIPTWREGDEFLAGENLQCFRILGIAPVDEANEVREVCDGFWMVESVGWQGVAGVVG